MTTIVTAFITNINENIHRDYDTYLTYGKKMLQMDVPCVCFVESHMYRKHFLPCLKDFPRTYFFMFEKHDNYLYEYIDQVTDYNLHSDNPAKDTIEYMFLQCHKTEFLRQVAEINPFQTTNVTWIDFGIYHMIQNDTLFTQGIHHVSQQSYPNIRVASCIHPSEPCYTDIYRFVVWFFAGSIIGGNNEIIKSFAACMRQKCISIIQEKHHIMWEINIWYMLYSECASWYNPYIANHDLSILQNY